MDTHAWDDSDRKTRACMKRRIPIKGKGYEAAPFYYGTVEACPGGQCTPEQLSRGKASVECRYFTIETVWKGKGCTADAGTDDRDSPALKKREAREQYLLHLKKTTVPTIIVGVWLLIKQVRKRDLLVTPEYQEKVAWAIIWGL